MVIDQAAAHRDQVLPGGRPQGRDGSRCASGIDHPPAGQAGQSQAGGLADLPGWQVVDAVDAPGAITGLKPTAGQDLAATRRRLIDDHGIATTVAGLARAPREMREPVLRISPQVDCSAEDLAQLRAALSVR